MLRMSLEYLMILNLTEISKLAYEYALNADQIRKEPVLHYESPIW